MRGVSPVSVGRLAWSALACGAVSLPCLAEVQPIPVSPSSVLVTPVGLQIYVLPGSPDLVFQQGPSLGSSLLPIFGPEGPGAETETLTQLAETLGEAGNPSPSPEQGVLDSAFDGKKGLPVPAQTPMPAAPPPVPPPSAPSQPSAPAHATPAKSALPSGFLNVAGRENRRWLETVVAEARKSRTGRSILGKVEQLSRDRGRPIIVEIVRLRSNHGEYVYDWDILRIAREYRKKDPVQAVPTLVHELAHILQKAQGLPVDAFEMELEAHVVSLKVGRDLGLRFEKDSFYADSERKFRDGLDKYVLWLKKEYKQNISLLGSTLEEYESTLRKRLKNTDRKIQRALREFEEKKVVIAQMRSAGQPERFIRTYALDHVSDLRQRLRDDRAQLKWLERDLSILRTPEGRKRYRAYARRIMAMVRRHHASQERRK